MKEKHPEYFSRLNGLKTDLRRKASELWVSSELETQIQSMQDFTSNNEHHFIKNLTPRLYKVDNGYKLNKPKLMRDIRIMRKCLDGKIPPVTVNDSEQLRNLLDKCRRNLHLDVNAPSITYNDPKIATDELTVSMNTSPVKNINNDKNFDDPSANVQSKCGSTEGKRNKEKKRHRRRKKKRRRMYSSSSSSDNDPNFSERSKSKPGCFDNRINIPSSFPVYGFYGNASNITGFSHMPGCLPTSSTPYPLQGFFPATPVMHPPVFENSENTSNPQQGLRYETTLPVHSYSGQRVANAFTGNSDASTRNTSTTVNFNVTSNSPEKWSALDTLVDVASEVDKK